MSLQQISIFSCHAACGALHLPYYSQHTIIAIVLCFVYPPILVLV